MPTVTVTEIVDRARAISDQADRDFVSETTWLLWVNQAAKQLALLIARAGYVYQERTSTFTATGAVAYSFPEPLAVVAVHEKDSSGRVRRLEAANAIEGFPSGGQSGPARHWRITSGDDGLLNLTLDPAPSSGTYLLTTISQPKKLVLASPGEGESDTVNFPMGWEEWIVLEAARRAIAKEEGDVRSVDKFKNEVEAHIEQHVWSRALADAPCVRDSRLGDGWTDLVYLGVPASWHFL